MFKNCIVIQGKKKKKQNFPFFCSVLGLGLTRSKKLTEEKKVEMPIQAMVHKIFYVILVCLFFICCEHVVKCEIRSFFHCFFSCFYDILFVSISFRSLLEQSSWGNQELPFGVERTCLSFSSHFNISKTTENTNFPLKNYRGLCFFVTRRMKIGSNWLLH